MTSVTVWTRLEPHPCDGSMQRSLQAQVRDPLWLLARQWQLGELAGEDAGSPVQATMSMQSRPLTGYAPNDSGVADVAFEETLALETHVERVPVTLNVRGSAQLGRHVENAIRAALPAAAAQAAIEALRSAYPIAATAPPDAAEDALGRAMRATLAGRVLDGLALAAAYAVSQSGGTPNPPPAPGGAARGVPRGAARPPPLPHEPLQRAERRRRLALATARLRRERHLDRSRPRCRGRRHGRARRVGLPRRRDGLVLVLARQAGGRGRRYDHAARGDRGDVQLPARTRHVQGH